MIDSGTAEADMRAAAEAWLLAGHSFGLHPRIAVGRFQSCWRRTDAPGPIEVAAPCMPFQPDDLDTKDPDEIGANYFAHTPKPDVLVLVDDDPE